MSQPFTINLVNYIYIYIYIYNIRMIHFQETTSKHLFVIIHDENFSMIDADIIFLFAAHL